MKIYSPTTKRRFIVYGITLYLLIPFVVTANVTINQRLEMYPIDADSISIPIFYSLFATVALSPVFVLFMYLGARKYKGRVSLLEWGFRKLYFIGLALVIMPMAFTVLVIYETAITYHFIMLIHWLLILYFVAVMRVAISVKEGV
jgi:hypothetical protein